MMNRPAGRTASCPTLREARCKGRKIGAVRGMSPDIIARYSRFADQKRLAKAAARRLEEAQGL